MKLSMLSSLPFSSSSNGSCEACGWVAAFIAILAFGSFGVPVKSDVAKSLQIDPLVMQSYKTGMCFVTSWIFVYIRGERVFFTPMGIVSGLFWVPGGIATIYAIQTAGIAVALSVGCSCIVLVSFTWGIFYFEDHVHSRIQACFAVVCMLLGLCGMAYYSAPNDNNDDGNGDGDVHSDNVIIDDPYCQPLRPQDSDFLPADDEDDSFGRHYVSMETTTTTADDDCNETDGNIDLVENPTSAGSDDDASNTERLLPSQSSLSPLPSTSFSSSFNPTRSIMLCWGYVQIQERILGILAAAFITGLWGGSMMVPMEFAPKVDKGLPFLISFAIGATLVTISFWFFRFLYLVHVNNYCFRRAYNALPSFHFKKMWPYGMTCGLVWSIGNFCSILSVEFLGEGVGYSVTQAGMLVGGLWGIFYFREIQGASAISKWFMSASVTVIGILLLSFEHHEP